MRDRIILENMYFYGYHGVMPAENELGQHFAVTLVLEKELQSCGYPDELGCTIDYARVYFAVKEIMEGRPYKLLETVAEKIAGRILELGADWVRVSVKKLSPPLPGALDFVAVEIERGKGGKTDGTGISGSGQ